MKRVALFVTVATLGAACESNRQATTLTARDTAVAVGEPRAEDRAAASDATLRRPLLWSVEKAGHTTYFLGTMHVGVEADRLPSIVWSKLRDARVFAMEANLDDPRTAALFKPTPRSLRRDLGDAYWQKLEEAIGPQRAQDLEHMPPMIPATALSLRGLPATTAMDKVLAARAAGDRKPIVYLEEATHQIALLTKWMNIKALKMMLDELPRTEQHTRAMLAAYIAGDDREILAISERERDSALRHGYTDAEYDQEMQELLYDRNASWIAALEQLHAGGGGFVAVGAMHLVGPRSVLDLLARKDYKVTRIGATEVRPGKSVGAVRDPAAPTVP
jgi:uncharacterized protein